MARTKSSTQPTYRAPGTERPAPVNIPPRTVTTVLPTPLQTVKLDALLAHLARHDRTLAPLPDEQGPEQPVILLVLYRNKPEGLLWFDQGGRTLGFQVHQGLYGLITEVALAGEWTKNPPTYLESLARRLGHGVDLQDLQALHASLGWT